MSRRPLPSYASDPVEFITDWVGGRMILSMIGLVAGSFMNLFGEIESSTGASCVDRERGVRAVMGGACPTRHGHRSSLGDPRTERGLALGKCQTHVVHLHDQATTPYTRTVMRIATTRSTNSRARNGSSSTATGAVAAPPVSRYHDFVCDNW